MIDLKKEIEKLKNRGGWTNDTFYHTAINDVEVILDQYNIGELSDGYHTFNSLYEQRMYLFATIVNQNKDKAWKSYKHEDGELCFGGGWFIVGVDTPNGSYTYHYENKYYDLFECEELECGKHWDGHTDKDVDRVLSLANYNIITAPKTIKLSEIVSRLKETIKEKISIDDGYRCEKAIGYYTRCWEDWDFIEIVGFDKDMKITQVGVCYERFEWLYTLWIAGTIIEDDLKEE